MVIFLGPGFIFAIMFCMLGPGVPKGKKHTFGAFGGFGGSPFFDVFLVPLLDGILVSFGAKVAPQRELLGVILETIW